MVYIKSPSELTIMREAGKIAGNALAYGGSLVKEGVISFYFDSNIKIFIDEQGANH